MNGEDKRKNLRDVLDELDSYFGQFEKDVQAKVRDAVSGARIKEKPFVAGFAFKLGPEGKPSVQLFGDSPVRAGGYRSPLTEQILDAKGGTLKLIVDMPGVEKSDIKVDATDESAVITAEGASRKYKADVSFKSRVGPEEAKAEYKNGLLEILFPLKDKTNKDYRRLNVV